jgi:predicted NAD/FAD-binding protein
MQRIAIVGGGGGGMGAAYALGLGGNAEVTVFEANAWLGGNARTVDVPCEDGITRPIDMGVILSEPWTYPVLYAICKKYGIASRAVGWTVGASFQDEWWYTGGPDTPLFSRMRDDCSRFELDTYWWKQLSGDLQMLPVQQYLTAGGYSDEFAAKALAPVLCLLVVTRQGLVSAPLGNILGLFSDKQLSFFNATMWRLFPEGTRAYIDALRNAVAATTTFLTNTPVTAVRRVTTNGATSAVITTAAGEQTFDQVIFGTQADITLQILTDVTAAEKAILGQFEFQKAQIYLHKDTSVLSKVLPQNLCSQYWYDGPTVTPTLQGPFSLNPGVGLGLPPEAGPVLITGYDVNATERRPREDLTFAYSLWEHEVATLDAAIARSKFSSIQGAQNTWHCGTSPTWPNADAVLTSGMVVACRPQLGGVFPFTDGESQADYQMIEQVMFGGTSAQASPVVPTRVGYRRTT